MNLDHFPVDLVILTLLAIFIALRLRSVLGKRSENSSYPTIKSVPGKKLSPQTQAKEEPPKEVTLDIPTDNTRVGGVLAQLHQKEPSFSPHKFLLQVQVVFKKVLEAYAKGNEDILKTFLTPNVFHVFSDQIRKRKEAQEQQKCEIKDIRSLAIEDAQLQDAQHHSLANISVRILSDQVNHTLSKEGETIDGVDATMEFSDLWIFERVLGVSGTGWRLAGTRSA